MVARVLPVLAVPQARRVIPAIPDVPAGQDALANVAEPAPRETRVILAPPVIPDAREPLDSVRPLAIPAIQVILALRAPLAEEVRQDPRA